jgi:hypothetical protein
MRHSAAHVMAEAVWASSRTPSWASARRSTTASTTTSCCRARSRPTTSPRSRPACAPRSPPTTRSSARKSRSTRAAPSSRRAPAVQGRDPRRPGAQGRRSRLAASADVTYQHGTFIDLCKGPHVASTGKIGPFKLMTVAGAYWRGSEKRPMLQRIYGTVWPTQEELDALPAAPRGSQEARPSPPRRPARPVQLPRRQPRFGLLAPQGPAPVANLETRCARSRSGAATRKSARRCSSTRSCGSSPATGPTTRTTCSSSSPRARPSASSR